MFPGVQMADNVRINNVTRPLAITIGENIQCTLTLSEMVEEAIDQAFFGCAYGLFEGSFEPQCSD